MPMHITILLTLSILPGEAKLPVCVRYDAYLHPEPSGWDVKTPLRDASHRQSWHGQELQYFDVKLIQGLTEYAINPRALMYVCMYVCIKVGLHGIAHCYGQSHCAKGRTHRARGSNIPTPWYHQNRVTHAGSYSCTQHAFSEPTLL